MPKYIVNGKTYNIPDDKVAGFESRYPNATVEYHTEDKTYQIPLSKRNGFLKRFPNASYNALVEQPATQTSEKPLVPTYGKPEQSPVAMSAQQQQSEPEYVEGFGEGFKQGWQGLVSGSKYFAGEIANAFSGSSMDDKNALGRWDELQKRGVDIAAATDMKKWGEDAMVNDGGTLRALTQQEKLDYETIQKAIQEAGGDLDKARKLMEQRAKETTWGDSLKQEAAEEMNQMKPTKGFGAWVGNLAPQMIPSAAALALAYFTKNPKWAKMVGNIGMAGMTASTAGSTMKEARDAGASDMQVWGAGVADGTIEYLTEKLPFDKLTNRIFGNTKKKLSREIADGLADNPQTRDEMERLLGEAANRAGLNWKQVGKSVLAQTTAEGLSEAAAGTLQTATQMIYQEPENYPTLYDYVTNAWEGTKAGMFMGAVLGAPVPLAQKVQNDKRRKKQGEVYVAGYINDNGETEVVEVVGSSKDGNLVVFGQSGYKEISPEDVTYAHTFSYQEFKSGELQQEFDNGYDLETSQEMTDAKNMYDMQRQRVADALGEDMLADIDRDPEAAIGKLGEDEPTNRTVIEYLNAKMVYDGMNKRVADDADARIAESDALVDSHTHKKTGMVQGATMKNEDRKVYIVNGNVVPLQDGTGIDLDASDNSIIIRDAESGELEQVSPEVLLGVDAALDPTAEKQAAREAIESEVRANAERMQNGVVGFAPGDVYSVLGEDGNTHQVEIVQDNGDNTVTAKVDGEVVRVMAKEQIQNEVDAYNKQRVVVVAESAEDAENAEEAKPNYELNAHVTLQTPEGVVTGNINQAENDDNLIEVQVNKPFGGKKTVDMYTREELDNMVVEVADENGNVIWSKPAENAEAAANVQGSENTNTPPQGGAENVNTATAAPIVRGKQDQIDVVESIKAGTTPQEMADAFEEEFGDEDGLPLSTAQENLAQVQEERQKTKDVNLKNGPLRKQEKFWSEVVDLLTPKEETVAEEGRQETVGTPVALQYLLEGGKGSIENAGYFFYAIQAAFPHIGAQLQEIRNSMPAEMLGMAPDAFVASNPSQLQEVRGLVEATYGEAGTRILDQMLANSTGFYPREGKALDLEIENLKPVEGNEQVQEVTEKDSLLKKVKDWLSPENISWAEGKSLSESIEMFGNEVEPIAIIPPVLKKYFPELSNLYLYSGKAYLIDHAANHHPELSVEEYENIQKTLDEYDDIKDLSSNGVKKLAFIKMMEKGYAVVTELSEKDGKIMLHKTFFYKDVNGKRVPYKNKPSLFDKTSVDGSTTISPAEKTTAGRHRNISALDVSADKGTDKSVTQEGTQEEISEKAQNATQSEQNELEKAEKKRIDALVPAIEDVADDMQTADEFVAGLFGNGIRITPESFRKETGLGWEEQRRLVGIIAGKEKGGLTVEQAAEAIVENYRAELAERGFSGDSMEMRDMVIDILSSGNPRAYAKQAAARRAEQALHREMEAFDRYTQEAFHMSAEEYIMYEESMLPKYIEQYKDFDEQEYYSNFADEQSTQNEHDTTRESAETGGSREILSEEQPSATPGEGTAGEGQQGGTLQGDVQGNAQEGIARAEAGQEVAEESTGKENQTRFSTSIFDNAERIAREEQRRAPLRKRAREWERILGVKVHLIERLEDVKNPDAIREIQASEKRGKKNVPGWFEGSTGEVFVYLPHVENEKEVDKTCVHEIVSHKGLKELLGQEKFDELCRKVWGIMSPAARKKYRNYPNVHNELEAADEYIAHLSEEVNLNARERSVWQKIMDFIADLLGRKADNRSKAASIVGKEALSRKDIAELVRLSYAEYLQRNGREEAVKETVGLREAGESQTMLRIVDDPNVIAELEASPKRRGFRNVVRNEDGTFSSPMAYWLQSTTGGAKTRVETAKFELGKWEKAEEHPELVDENGKIVLVKPDKGTIPVAYDPYIHNRLDPVNLQFKDAWKRNDLIYVETEVPTTDLESGYHADKALLPVGVHSWSNGDLMLSIYDKPTRFVPWDEVADAWAERLAGKEVHFDVVPPLMRSLLVERGVDIVPPHKGMGKDCRDAYADWKNSVDGNNVVRFRFTEEEQGIIDEAKKNGTYMKAPNGQPTNLNEKQWAQVRTKAFKKWFGEWEKVLRIAKLRKSKPVSMTGKEHIGKYELNRGSAQDYILKNLRGSYEIADTKESIKIAKKGAKKVTSHSMGNEAHMMSIAIIPEIIESSIFITELPARKDDAQYDSYRYYVCGLDYNGENYTVKITVGVKNGDFYYDHSLTEVEKGKLLDLIESNQAVNHKGFTPTGDAPIPSYALSGVKDTKLLSILQANSSKIVDENGEPLVVYHQTENSFTEFDPYHEGAGASDHETPFGIFLKPTPRNIGIRGSIQMPLYAEVRNPLTFTDRKGLSDWLNRNVENYSELAKRLEGVESEYKARFDEAMSEDNKLAVANYEKWQKGEISKDEYMESYDGSKAETVLKEWKNAEDVLRVELKRMVDDAIRSSNYDGVILESDKGSFGRETKTLVALDPNQIKSATENSGEFSKENNDIRFRFIGEQGASSLDKAEEAVEKNGIVAPGLKEANVDIVDVERHDFSGTGNEAIRKAKEWADKNIVGEHTAKANTTDEFVYTIDEKSIKKYLSSVATGKSDNLGVHLSVLKRLPDVIDKSIEAEIHADYKKTDGRTTANGVEDKDLLIHRFYGCVRLNNELHRVKITLKERKSEGVKPYSYEVTKIESLSGSSQNGTSLSDALNNSIPAAKLLENVEKSYDKGVKLLDASEDLTYKTRKDASQRVMDIEKSLLPTSETYFGAILSDAKIPQIFETPSVEDNYSREGVGSYTDDEVSFENDPISKVLGKPRFTRKQRREFAERERQRMVARVENLAKKLNLDNVEVVTDASTLEGKKQRAKGFYSKRTGKITIVIPNHSSTFDVEQTLLHEAVAHYGLRQLFGEHFDSFLDNVFNNADEAIRQRIVALAAKNGWDFHTATEEYLAKLAESTYFEQAQKSGWWQEIKRSFLRMLRQIGFDYSGPKLSDNELRYILWRSYENLAEPGRYRSILGEAADMAKQYELGVGNYSNTNLKPNFAAEVDDDLYRDGDPEIHERMLARDRYEERVKSGMFQSQEALQDSMLGLKEAMQAILGKETYIEDVAGHENAYLGENRLSSVNKAEADAFARLLFKPMLDEVAKLARNEAERQRLTDYLMAKHGLERNMVMYQKNKQEAIDKWIEERTKQLVDGGMAQADARTQAQQDIALYPSMSDSELDKQYRRDYAGLTALTGMKKVAKAEAEAQRMVEDYEQAHDTTGLWRKVNAVSKAILQKSYECGMMSKETFDKLSGMYEFYIPLRGFDEKTSAEAYAYLTSKHSAFNAPIKKAKGRRSKADDPFAYLQSMAEGAIMQGNRNKLVKQRFLNFALNHPSDLVSVSELWVGYNKVKKEWEPVFPDNIESTDTPEEVERKMQDFEANMESLAQQHPDQYKRGKDAAKIPYRVVEKQNKREHQVVVKRGGRDYVITINGNPRAAQALNGQTNPDNDMSGAIGAILRAGEKINRQLSAFYTTRNPDFILSNFLRDTLYTNTMVWIKESPNYAWRFHRNFATIFITMKRLLAKYRKGELDMRNKTEAMFHQFMMNGGETGYTNIRDIEQHKNDIKRELKKSKGRITIQRAWDFLAEQFDELNRTAENCARFAAFVTSREMGRSIDRAIYDAKEISVNFNKKGSGAKFYDSVGQTKAGNASALVSGLGRSGYAFWNASIQGTTNFGRQMKRHPAKAFTGAAVMFLLGAIVPYLAGDDDEDDKNAYHNLPDYVRRSNILLRAGDSWISIPLPIEYRAMYGMGELMTSVLSGKEHLTDVELAEAILGQATQILPIDVLEGGGGLNAFVPSSIKPAWEAHVAEKSWTGMPLYKDTPFNKDMPEWTKAYSSANKYIVNLAAALNEATGGDPYTKGTIDFNPAKVEYMLNGYFGGVSGTIDKLTKTAETIVGDREYDPRSILFVNRVVKAGDERTEYRAVNNEYSRLKEEHDRLKTRLRNYEEDTDNGIFDYAEKIDFLYNSPEYERYEIFEDYRKDIDYLYDELQEAVDDEERKQIEAELNELKKEMIQEMNTTRERKWLFLKRN